MCALILLAIFAEVLVQKRALIVRHEGKLYFPTYTAFHPGTDFGLGYTYETDYRELREKFRAEKDSGNFVLMPLVPYDAYESDYPKEGYPPEKPSIARRHFLGTDTIGRDILARLFYGFRIAIFFSLLLMLASYVMGIALGCAMGYFGGLLDLLGQRLVEIWSVIPFLYVVILVASIVQPNFWLLLIIVAIFSWMGMTYYMRTGTYKERARDYVAAARVLGAGPNRVVFRHIFPNLISTVVTFMPFTVASGIVVLTSLDFLGFGLPAPTPSWGELLKQGNENLREAPWITLSTFAAMVVILSLVTFVGEAIREAFDPKKFTTYR
ncbi:MAG: ABC transporter permease subunit [Verrucomicrobiae bacterium]|nr:ABC transporter permease subunit [Verrucomicrobiae bacterium]MCP5541170.1 ABC transporter permease subunit [Akkermansiaceae bacterium]MCP5550490.1 ABC transporter permease subunit [Akkermansiaceae bacterium]